MDWLPTSADLFGIKVNLYVTELQPTSGREGGHRLNHKGMTHNPLCLLSELKPISPSILSLQSAPLGKSLRPRLSAALSRISLGLKIVSSIVSTLDNQAYLFLPDRAALRSVRIWKV